MKAAGRCWVTSTGARKVAGKRPNSWPSAWMPPVEAPIATRSNERSAATVAGRLGGGATALRDGGAAVIVRGLEEGLDALSAVAFDAVIADRALGETAMRAADGANCVTIQMEMQFVDTARLGDWITVAPEVIKRTGSLVFLRCELRHAARVVGVALGDDGGPEGVDGARGEDESSSSAASAAVLVVALVRAGEEAHHVLVLGRAMEPPLEVGRQQLLRPARVAGVERLVQPQHKEAVALLRRLPGGGERRLRRVQLRRLVRARRRRRSLTSWGSQLAPAASAA